MPKTNTKVSVRSNAEGEPSALTNSTIELVNWPVLSSSLTIEPSRLSALTNEKVFALQTTRLSSPFTSSLNNEKSPFDSFNLGLHVGDSAEQVTHNRKQLNQYISQQVAKNTRLVEPVNIQWLEQVHGNHVVEITSVSKHAITADASITRQKNITLAIMTADCLPILLSQKDGAEIAAIHGGWRPLAANIIEKTIEEMHSNPAELVAWLGPCIGSEAFEVGFEVKAEFMQQDKIFSTAFVKQTNGKYLADLYKIAQIQLHSLGVSVISSLDECTYQRTDKYYSYRKEQVTGRMASLICRI
jgi:YfiH family protein